MTEKICQIRKIIDSLNKYREAYYNNNNSLISDQEYDKIFDELKKLEDETQVYYADSPTQSVGYEAVSALKKVQHNHLMLSLLKSKKIEDIISFLGTKENFLAMLKLDGLTCSLRYLNGKLVSAETRGNGEIGEDILHNILTLKNVPKEIPYKDELIVDGEVICKVFDFKPFEKEYKNIRNFASGSIRLLDAKECQKRNLSFIAWEVIKGLDEKNSLFEKLREIENFGFETVPKRFYSFKDKNILTIKDLEEWKNFFNEEYPSDGLVFKFDDIPYSQSLGYTSHHFNNAIALKFYDEEYETVLKDIEWTMGRSGVLTPIAIFNPIEIDNTKVERASLHNLSILKSLSGGVERTGDILHIIKANQIIPQVVSWRPGKEKVKDNIIKIPIFCPICGEKLIIKNNNDIQTLWCINEQCESRLINRLEHFCGKKGFDIKGLSKATLEKLISYGWLNSCKDIFLLKEHKQEWISKSGFGEKSVSNILNAIEESKEISLSNFICALGIPLIGKTASSKLEEYFKDYKTLRKAIQEKSKELYQIKDFGEIMCNNLLSFDFEEADSIVKDYISFKEKHISKENEQELKDLIFVITGKLSHFKNRNELKTFIESKGGIVSSAISKKTNYLINNDIHSNSAKNVKAQQFNIPILLEEEFLNLVKKE